MKKIKQLFIIITAFIFCGLAVIISMPSFAYETYYTSEVGLASEAVNGVVVARRIVHLDGNSGIGGLAGLTAGTVAGSAIGGSYPAHILGAVGGAIVGGMLGNSIDHNMNSGYGYEYFVKTRHGTVSVIQPPYVRLRIHQRVLVVYGPTTRLIPVYTR